MTTITKEQRKALLKVHAILNTLNLEIHNGEVISDNDKILTAMEAIEVHFEDELF